MLSIREFQIKNPWWLDENYLLPESNWPKRDLFSALKKNLDHPLILNIIGLRRVGKSTIIKQIIADVLSKGIKRSNIFYFLFDYSSQIQKAEFLDNVLSFYISEVLVKIVTMLDETIYVFLDEIQYIEDWQSVLKKYYDLSNQKIKFIISGSQSILLRNTFRESLAGRIFDYYLPPLSFREFIIINDIITDISIQFDLFDIPQFWLELNSYHLQNNHQIKSLSKEYIISGQFPESRKLKSLENKQEYIKESVLGKVLDDCIRIFKIEKSDEFKLIAFQLLNNVSSLYELKNIGREIAVARDTLEKYFQFIRDGYIVEILYKYHKSLIKQGRILKKLYTTCVNFPCALNHYREEHLDEVPDVFGKIIENLMYNSIRRRYPEMHLAFYRKGEKEIDFILINNKNIVPIEVKFSSFLNSKDFKMLCGYIQDKKLKYAIIITKDVLDKRIINNQIVYFIPYYLILLI